MGLDNADGNAYFNGELMSAPIVHPGKTMEESVPQTRPDWWPPNETEEGTKEKMDAFKDAASQAGRTPPQTLCDALDVAIQTVTDLSAARNVAARVENAEAALTTSTARLASAQEQINIQITNL